jgi:hypothetical protein
MAYPTAAAPARRLAEPDARLSRTATRIVNLAAVAARADEHLRLAANTQEQSGRPLPPAAGGAAWTPSATDGVMPRHAYSALRGHGVEPGLGNSGRRRTCQSADCHRAIVRSPPAVAVRPSVRRRQACTNGRRGQATRTSNCAIYALIRAANRKAANRSDCRGRSMASNPVQKCDSPRADRRVRTALPGGSPSGRTLLSGGRLPSTVIAP